MGNANKNFLERLQSSNETTKRKWMFATTLVIMMVVVYVWLAYFNNLVGGFNEPQAAASPEGSFTFLESLKNGTAVIYQTFNDKLRAFGQILASPREYIINPPK